MSYLLIYYFAVIIFLLIGVSLAIYFIFSVIAFIYGGPFVPTNPRLLKLIFKEVGLKANQRFIELGSGDGRVAIYVAKQYGVSALGIEVNPLLVLYSRIAVLIGRVRNVKFKLGNFFNEDLSRFDVISFFLMPETVEKLGVKLKEEAKKGTIVISHGFEIHSLKSFIISKIKQKPFSSFIYRL